MARDELIEKLIGIEGGYSDHPADSGGKTRYGVTENLARAYGYEGEMKDLPLWKAKDIYNEAFWQPLMLDSVLEIYPQVAYELLDSGVNVGVKLAGRWLQRTLNAFSPEEDRLKLDGIIGGKTIALLRKYKKNNSRTDQENLVKALNCLQGTHYIDLANNRPKDRAFVTGWYNKRVGMPCVA